MGDTAEGLASAPQSQDGSRDPAAEREIAGHYSFAPIYPPLETIRETLYDSAALQDEIDRNMGLLPSELSYSTEGSGK